MILQALTDYYETLRKQEKVAEIGWCQAKVGVALNLDGEGRLKSIISLKEEKEVGKKTIWAPAYKKVPQMETRTVGVRANFLCDNSKYILGVDADGCEERTVECFEAAKQRHLNILRSVDNVMAKAVKNFFESWNPQMAESNEILRERWEEITDGSNLVFVMDTCYAQDDEEIGRAWRESLEMESDEVHGICLVTGKEDAIARTHALIKGVQGAQSSGASLVSFNAAAFESYGKEQGYNAPVGKYATFAYTTALNYLLTQKDYVFRFGDTTVVFWAEQGEEIYQDVFSWSLEPKGDNAEIIKNVFQNIKERRAIDIGGIKLDGEQKFFILGLAPNAARLSVRFFYENTFGNILENIQKHYAGMRLVRPSWIEREYLGVGSMLYETVNKKSKDKNPTPNLPGAVLKAILTGGRYPENLYGSVMIRIRAEQGEVTWGRAAIIKACLIRNYKLEKEDEFVELNEKTNDTPYVLGRMFAILENIQKEANPGIKATIRDRYFNAACASPASVFPVLLKLKNSHVKKLERQKEWKKVVFEKSLTELAGKMEEFPKRLTLEEQGRFILGYYHQVQKRYEKKEEE